MFKGWISSRQILPKPGFPLDTAIHTLNNWGQGVVALSSDMSDAVSIKILRDASTS